MGILSSGNVHSSGNANTRTYSHVAGSLTNALILRSEAHVSFTVVERATFPTASPSGVPVHGSPCVYEYSRSTYVQPYVPGAPRSSCTLYNEQHDPISRRLDEAVAVYDT